MTNIQFLNIEDNKSKSILVTSSNPLEGKTFVATSLAVEFAKAGKKVIIIDGDMRRGRIAKLFNLPNDLGFSNYLSNLDTNGNIISERITSFINDTEIKYLNVITSGNIPPNPTELFKTNKIKELIKELKIFYDIVIFDGVSILEAPEAIVLSEECDLTLILSSYATTKREDLYIAYEELKNKENIVLGMGFNKIPNRKIKKYINRFKQKIKDTYVIQKDKVDKALKRFGEIIILGCSKLVGGFKKITIDIKIKSENLKTYIKSHINRIKEIKLIEEGNSEFSEKEENIVKELFENEIENEEPAVLDDDIEYRKKLDNIKSNIDDKIKEVEIIANKKSENKVKSKFDLMLEQQKRENLFQKEPEGNEKLTLDSIESETNKKMEKKELSREELIEKQRIERELKRSQEENRVDVRKRLNEIILENDEIDFQNPENLTEEMIRIQVERDEMIRLAKRQEKKEKKEVKRLKSDKRYEKMQEVKNKVNIFLENIKNKKEIKKQQNLKRQEFLIEQRIKRNELKIREKLKKEIEKNDNKERIAKVKEEKKAYKELEKQKHKEELRINEQLQENNLYPKPKM